MSRPTTLALAYLGLAAVWQVVLWNALPNAGMGGLAIVYLVGPLLVLSAIGLWFISRKTADGRTVIFVLASMLMLVGSLAVHPQDSQTGFLNKLGRILQYIAVA